MALLMSTTAPLSLTHLPSSSQSNCAVSVFSACSLYKKPSGLQTHLFNGLRTHSSCLWSKRSALIVKASAEADGLEPPSETEQAAVPVESLPLESKLQLKLEQKMRMKLAKKIRLKRKRLVKKRHLRKKGRWPPSKMKKNKNV